MLYLARTWINHRFAKMEERGASAVEYGLLIAGIAVLIIGAVFALGGTIGDLFEGAGDDIENGPADAGAGADD